MEYISQRENILRGTPRGRISRTIQVVEKFLGPLKELAKKYRNIVQVLKEGGPASLLLDDAGQSPTTWERAITLRQISLVFTYKRDHLIDLETQARLYNPDASRAIVAFFLSCGWSFSELLGANTTVMEVLRPYLQHKRPRAGDESQYSRSTNKRRRVNPPEVSISYSDPDLSLASLE